ncbi:ABC transporter permease [Dongia sedimenti]|uniref:ABC transporter permease n=1 Tax=Dongia sedimenti TaxID=3064282 RepID=A0ABU0YFT8_9PROT|nr:ABC transporter permease [Rhodospirillaceae bacterium R-7]
MRGRFATYLPLRFIASLCIIFSFWMPLGTYDADLIFWNAFPSAVATMLICLGCLAVAPWVALRLIGLSVSAATLILLPTAESFGGLENLLNQLLGLGSEPALFQMGLSASGFWLALIGIALFTWIVMADLAAMPRNRWRDIAIPLIFGLLLVYLWQAIVIGFAVPKVLLPAPAAIAQAIRNGAATLADDFAQTFLKSVLAGFVIGNAIGFATALLADRYPFLQRGLLPLGNFASAVPIIGIAPIMVMWFGFGWESKSAVVVLMIFFPMLVNTLAGLNAADRMSLDLMRSYGAGYVQTLLKLRLPMALPFIFNALKINSTLALIGAIVAEFFGSPTAGMGFRINIENARMGLDVVWATIAVAAVAGSAFYGILALLERAFTFWHPSYRAQN